jgi:predicted AlkP superfamily phosphohydrolase/phosphomutase
MFELQKRNWKKHTKILLRIPLLYLLSLFFAAPALAYIGPGAGFAFFSSMMVFALSFLAAIFAILMFPLRLLFKRFRRKEGRTAKRISTNKKVVLIGLDGLSPVLTQKFMEEGLLPNFSKLKDSGTFKDLGTTSPPISPVAWSTFISGSNPGRHNIFDFLTRDPKTYMPILASAEVEEPSKTLSFGKYRIPLSKPKIIAYRKGTSLWGELGKYGIPGIVIRVPITFPPDIFQGRILSSMGVPDLRGTQGTFSFYSSIGTEDEKTGGERFSVRVLNNKVKGVIRGPENSLLKKPEPLTVPFAVHMNGGNSDATLSLQGQEIPLLIGEYSDWVTITFKLGLGMKAQGICRFYLTSIKPDFQLYVSPINIDPEKPALPIAHPMIYSLYLSKVIGRFSTLGLAEDTWALNEGALDENAFLKQCYLNHEEREKMLFHEFKRFKRGLLCCVFDTTDRIQHMFWRDTDPAHPMHKSGGEPDYTIFEELYKRMDDLIGRVMEKIDKDTLLMVISDHGFSSFRRGVNLNTWLHRNGFLAFKEDTEEKSGKLFENVDWSKTRAYAIGLSGIFINQKGREGKGVVEPGLETEKVKNSIIDPLKTLVDEEHGQPAIHDVLKREEIYSGPSTENAPDLIVAYGEGYRASWNSVMGGAPSELFEDNLKAWSGDHSLHPDLVPGVFLCNQKMISHKISIMDLAPTLLKEFDVPIPIEMDGRPAVFKL